MQRACCLVVWIALALLLPGLAAAQAPAAPAAAPPPVAAPQSADVEALDRVLALLNDEASRAALVAELEKLKASLQAAVGGQAGDAPGEGPPAEDGLLGALATGIASVGQELPQRALGGPIDERIGAAAAQVQDRVEEGVRSGRIENFLTAALPGWGLALLVAWAAKAMPWVRRGRTIRLEAASARARGRRLLHLALLSTWWELLPLGLGMVALAAWPLAGALPSAHTPFYLALAMPVIAASLLKQLLSHGLMLLGPIRKWRNVAYAWRRVVPWLSGLAACTAAAGILRSPAVRGTIGFSAADLATLLLDLGIAGLAIAFIVTHRQVVRYLLMGRRLKPEEEQAFSLLRRVLRRVALRWHVVAMVFVVANLLARLLRLGDGYSILNAMLALFAVILGVVVALALDSLLARSANQLRRGRPTTLRRIGIRAAVTLRPVLHAAITVALLVIVLEIWGFRVWAWLQGDVGRAILRPLLSIGSVVAIGWLAWVTIDSFIAQALTGADPQAPWRRGGNRARTLLPFLRNLAFVTLLVVGGIAVLANLGVNVAPLLAGAGVVGLAIGFGSQQLVQDLITGLFILFEDTIAVGDVIDTGDRAGTVEALTIRTVRIRDGDGALHSIPFSQIKALKNRSRDYGVYTVKVTVGYDADLAQVMAAMREVGGELQRDPSFAWQILAPLEVWGVDAFTAEGVVVMGAIRTRPLQQWSVGRELNLRLKRRLDALGILIAIPRMSLLPPHDGQPTPAAPQTAAAAPG